jgi:hypothetical protein
MPRLRTRDFSGEEGERLFGQEVLRKNGGAVGHGEHQRKKQRSL